MITFFDELRVEPRAGTSADGVIISNFALDRIPLLHHSIRQTFLYRRRSSFLHLVFKTYTLMHVQERREGSSSLPESMNRVAADWEWKKRRYSHLSDSGWVHMARGSRSGGTKIGPEGGIIWGKTQRNDPETNCSLWISFSFPPIRSVPDEMQFLSVWFRDPLSIKTLYDIQRNMQRTVKK